jgi:hypothetical protein
MWSPTNNFGDGFYKSLDAPSPRTEDLRARKKLEAPPGFEPGMEVLQTSALPLGDGAVLKSEVVK